MSWYSQLWKRVRGREEGRADGAPPPAAGPEESVPPALTLRQGHLKLLVGVVSSVGNHREHNEDNFFVPGLRSVAGGGSSESTTETLIFREGSNLFIVADGMGGQQAGEEASRMAVEIVPRSLARRLPPGSIEPRLIQTAVREAVAEANQEILGTSGAVAECSNMGTTVVLALFQGEKLYVAGVGDSRAYLLRGGSLEQLTKDHSLADALHDAGTITKEELPNHKFKNILYLYLGSKDARGGPEEVRVLDVKVGDRLLLASDGLTGVVDDPTIARLLADHADAQRAAKALKDRALSNLSKDNVTCLVVHVVAD